MTEPEIAALGPAFAAYLRRFRRCFRQDRTAGHFDTYCRGLLTDLPGKSVEPIAPAAGAAVRTLQEFLTTARWDHTAARDALHRHLAGALAATTGGWPRRPPGRRRGTGWRAGRCRRRTGGRRPRRCGWAGASTRWPRPRASGPGR